MVRITNLKGEKLAVPTGAFREIYKPQGWFIDNELENTSKNNSNEESKETSGEGKNPENGAPDAGTDSLSDVGKDTNPADNSDRELEELKAKAAEFGIEDYEDMTKEELETAIEDEEEEEDLSEIPLSEMSVPQLYAYATQLGIDVKGLNGAKALRAAIKKHRSRWVYGRKT